MVDIKLIQGDCLEVMNKLIEQKIKVDAIITDPPYGMNLKPQRISAKFKNIKIINDNTLDWCDDFFDMCYKLTPKNSGSMFFCSQHSIDKFIVSGKKSGFDIKNLMVWDKDWFGMGGNWRPNCEFILLMTKGRFVTHSNNKSNILKFRRLSSQKMQHVAQKPVELMEELIKEPDYDPMTILDPFMGSGTTGVACVNLNRNFIGIELDENYFNIAQNRIEEAKKNIKFSLKN